MINHSAVDDPMPNTLREPIADRVLVAQVQSLFSSAAPSIAMAGIFLLATWVAYKETAVLAFVLIGAVGSFVNVWRIAAVLVLRPQAFSPFVDKATAAHLERRFTIPYVSFAITMGAFGFRSLYLATPELHMLTVCVAVGYCAGVAATCSLRPKLASACIILAIGPIVSMALTKGDETYSATAVIAIALVAGAIRSMIVRYDDSRSDIAMRVSSVSLARQDVLTSLPNRLALQEFFDARSSGCKQGALVAVHYLDLDGFKPVNDQHGHDVGDRLLLAVSGRLKRCIRDMDMVARLGGDEFAVVQFELSDQDQAHQLAWRIRDAVQRSYQIDNLPIEITVSIGSVVSSDRSSALEELLRLADVELYRTKRARFKLGLNQLAG